MNKCTSKIMAVATMLLILTMVGCLSNNNTFTAYAQLKGKTAPHGPSIPGPKSKPLAPPHHGPSIPKPPHILRPMPRDQLAKISQDISQSHNINFNRLMDFAGLSSKFLLSLLYAGI
jgi:hypothetical protein